MPGVFDSIRNWFVSDKPTPITEPAGADGIAAPGGYLFRGERNPKLVGLDLWRTISNTLVDSIVVAAAVRYFLNLTAGTEWEIEARAEAGADGERAAKLVAEGLFEADLVKPWSVIVRKAALYKFYGFSVHEWTVRKRADGLIVYSDIAHRPQYTIQWWDKPMEQSPLMGLVQQTRQGNRYYLPRNRLFYCVDDTLTDSPDGVGLLRHTVGHTEDIKYLETLEVDAFRTDIQGVPLGRAPIAKLKEHAKATGKGNGWVESQIEAMQQFGQQHERTKDLSLIIDSTPYFDKEGHPSAVPQWAMDLLKGNGAPLGAIAAAINRKNLEVARVIGAEFLMMGGTSSGSGNRAMHEDKTEQFGSLIGATLGEMAAFARGDLARTLVGLNGLDPDLCTPKLLPGAVSTESVQSVAQTLLFLAQAGAPLRPGDPAVDILRARAHLCEQPKFAPELAGVIPRKPGQPTPSKPPAKQPRSNDGSVDVDVTDLDVDASSGLEGAP